MGGDGDINGNGAPGRHYGAGRGARAEVKAFSGKDSSVLLDFLAGDASIHAGIRWRPPMSRGPPSTGTS